MASVWKKVMRNLSMTRKSVFSNFREYACFFVALILVQLLFGVSALTYCNSNRIEKDYAQTNYDYHLVLKDLSSAQFYYICNVQATEQEKDWLFDLSYQEFSDSYGNAAYDAYITFRGDPGTSYEEFLLRYEASLLAEGSLSLSETALLTYEARIADNRLLYIGMTLLSAGLSFLLLTVLYRIKIDHFKFTYGIYLSFGADFKRLLTTAFSEMFFITALTVLPSTVLTYLIGVVIYAGRGGLRSFYLLPTVILLCGSALVSLLSVILPVLTLSKGRPVKLLLAEDNSNFVSSPRRSASLAGKTFPLQIEQLSVRRFRRYFVKLIAASSVFGMLFSLGVYLADCTTVAQETPLSQYTVDFSGSSYSADNAMEYLKSIDGVKAVVRDVSLSASLVNSNILVHKASLLRGADFTDYQRNEAYAGSMMVKYHAADADAIALLSDFYGYDYEGDLSRISEDDSYVVVSDSVDNRTVTALKPGDKILVAVECHAFSLVQTETEQFGFTVALEGNGLLSSYFDSCDYTYREFTVAAVIHGAPSGEELDVYLSPAAYTSVTHQKSTAQKAQIYLEETLSPEERESVETALRSLADVCSGMSYEDTGAAERKEISFEKHSYGLYLTIAVLALLVCPVLWIFSLTLFYKKRHLELDILRAVGAVEKELRGIFVADGLITSLGSAACYALFCFAGIGVCHFVINRSWFCYITGQTPGSFRYPYAIPWAAFFLGLFLIVLSVWIAVWVSYRNYRKRSGDHISESFTEDFN